MSNIQDHDDKAQAARHAWWPTIDYEAESHVWRCTCKQAVVNQPFGAPVPDELISHPQSFGQMRGE